MSYYSQLTAMNPDVAFMVGWVTFVSVYIVLKSTVWWLIFGTGRLLFGKYSLHEWGFRTGLGLAAFVGIGLLNVIFWTTFNPDSMVYMCCLWPVFLIACRITLREILSLFGLLRGDWNPFHPELRFIAWEESYLLCWLGNGRSSGNRKPTPWGSYADQEAAHWYQNMYDRQNGYTY